MTISRAGFPRANKVLYDQLDLLHKYKAADQTVNNSAVLVVDDTLQFPLLVNGKYSFELYLQFTTNSTADFKFRTVGPAAPTLVSIERRHWVPNTVVDVNALDAAFSAGDVAIDGAAGTVGLIHMRGLIYNGANAGTFSINWAQNTANASNTIVKAGSFVRAFRLN